MARNGLGWWVGVLMREPESQPVDVSRFPVATGLETGLEAAPGATGSHLVDIDLIEPSPFQPRTHFREEALAELAQSIQMSAIIQPLVLRRIASRYQPLPGEPRC